MVESLPRLRIGAYHGRSGADHLLCPAPVSAAALRRSVQGSAAQSCSVRGSPAQSCSVPLSPGQRSGL